MVSAANAIKPPSASDFSDRAAVRKTGAPHLRDTDHFDQAKEEPTNATRPHWMPAWQTWLLNQKSLVEPNAPPELDTPLDLKKNPEALANALNQYLRGLPENARSIWVRVHGVGHQELLELKGKAVVRKSVAILRIIADDGLCFWMEPQTQMKFKVETDMPTTEPIQNPRTGMYGHSFTVLPDRPDTAPWSIPRALKPLPELLQKKLRERGLTLPEASHLFNASGLGPISAYGLSLYLSGASSFIEYSRIKAFALFFNMDVRDWIASANLRFADRLEPADWTHEGEPLLIEQQSDLELLELFKREDPAHQSLGWLLYSSRKNPARHQSRSALVQGVQISAATLRAAERNLRPMEKQAVFVLGAYGASVDEIISATNRTFYGNALKEFGGRSILELLDQLFPGQIIFLEPASDDLNKVLEYAAKPGSLGQLFFTYRKSLAGLITTESLSKNLLHRHNRYWDDLERNRIPLDREHAAEWVGLFETTGLPMKILFDFFRRYKISTNDPAVILGRALIGVDREALVTTTGVDRNAITHILNDPHPSPSRARTILNLKEYLPRLDAARLYRVLHPDFKKYFPDSKFDLDLLLAALTFNPGDFMFEYRMEHNLTAMELARQLGVSNTTVFAQENAVIEMREQEALWELADLLAQKMDVVRARKMVYLATDPYVAVLLNVVTKEQLAALLSQRWRGYFPGLRRRLARAVVKMAKEDGDSPENLPEISSTLASILKISPDQASRFLETHRPLNLEEILRLKAHFPNLNVWEWYVSNHHAALAYFLGKNEEGSIRTDMPEGESWGTLNERNLRVLLTEAIDRFPTRDAAAKATGVGSIRQIDNLWAMIRKGAAVQDRTIAALARGLSIDRRKLYFHFRRHELKTVLAEVPDALLAEEEEDVSVNAPKPGPKGRSATPRTFARFTPTAARALTRPAKGLPRVLR